MTNLEQRVRKLELEIESAASAAHQHGFMEIVNRTLLFGLAVSLPDDSFDILKMAVDEEMMRQKADTLRLVEQAPSRELLNGLISARNDVAADMQSFFERVEAARRRLPRDDVDTGKF